MISIYFIAKSRSTQGIDVINSANGTVAYFYRKEQNIISYFNLKKVNTDLLKENTALRNQLFYRQSVDTFKTVDAKIPIFDYDKIDRDQDSNALAPVTMTITENPPLKVVRYAQYRFIPARVINNSISNDRINFITINQGSEAGIKPGMSVVSSVGIVGRVEHVSKHFATIASVLSNRKVSARLKLHEAFGQITWIPGHPDFVQMDNMPITLPIKLRDSVFTTGFASFPANILVGRVSHIDTVKSDNSLSLRIRLATNFRTLAFVYVVVDGMNAEKENLEKKDRSAR
ncbi:MAG TPA: rod shape-determining protein MreC [Edaphocola sp.]|nr:rod shape-determining protein MreC [Edaphocola sp.]